VSPEQITEANPVLYDKPEDDLSRQIIELETLPLLDEDGFEINVFNPQGLRVPRRSPVRYFTCGALLDLQRVHELYQSQEDTHGIVRNGTPYTIYPLAFTRTMGNVQSKKLMPRFEERLALIDNRMRPPIEEGVGDDNGDDNADFRRGPSVLRGTGSQIYNSLSHRVRNEAKFHAVQLGLVTSVFSGTTAKTRAGKRVWKKRLQMCKVSLPHQRFEQKVTGDGQPQTLRFENTYTLDVSRLVEGHQNGRYVSFNCKDLYLLKSLPLSRKGPYSTLSFGPY
jgi:hypothetical protein